MILSARTVKTLLKRGFILTSEDRFLLLEVHGGDPENLPFLYHLASHRHARELVKTVKRKGLRGKLLTQFIAEKCNGEPLKFLKWAITETLKVNTPKTPVVGKDGLFS